MKEHRNLESSSTLSIYFIVPWSCDNMKTIIFLVFCVFLSANGGVLRDVFGAIKHDAENIKDVLSEDVIVNSDENDDAKSVIKDFVQSFKVKTQKLKDNFMNFTLVPKVDPKTKTRRDNKQMDGGKKEEVKKQ